MLKNQKLVPDKRKYWFTHFTHSHFDAGEKTVINKLTNCGMATTTNAPSARKGIGPDHTNSAMIVLMGNKLARPKLAWVHLMLVENPTRLH